MNLRSILLGRSTYFVGHTPRENLKFRSKCIHAFPGHAVRAFADNVNRIFTHRRRHAFTGSRSTDPRLKILDEKVIPIPEDHHLAEEKVLNLVNRNPGLQCAHRDEVYVNRSPQSEIDDMVPGILLQEFAAFK